MTEAHVPLPAVPAVPNGAHPSGVDKDALLTRLDTLLEQYLHTLDEYEKLTQQLSQQLSSAFFSLTQANFHNRSGVHYGQDRYDERVQATRRIVISEDEEHNPHFSTTSTPTPGSSSAEPSTRPPPTATQEPTEDEPKSIPDPDPTTGSTEEESNTPSGSTLPDPLRMFGILVPPALRAAQASFRGAVEGPVVRLVGVAGELRGLEREIGRVRKSLRKSQI
ncbi:uncharacterized protein EKO05_0004553 [Ascochyta rabiei]|uniref:Vacuolar ATPase assembly protein VMA22 n=1 Tax=Didymella rabiei TaxID=5454 RepID=A0A162Z986_DIDRA|nr:uncharacterized protein EKO05_0004553 [Ascochyta rabiei]KZM20475.1 hypothetical protein ST47_g8360 [Ascochyta rabiei]UPX14061.1 hypothetical protein EKO05_0004553 [Ascochyta rabiei]